MSLLAGRTLRVIDTETTGMSPSRSEVIEVSSVRVDDGVVGEGWSSLVHPRRRIPPDATRVHGITDAMVQEAPAPAAVAATLREELAGHPLVFHNAAFDLPFLKAMMRDNAQPPLYNPIVDTLGLARAWDPAGSHGLGRMSERVGVPRRDRHRALPDAITTAQLLVVLVERFEKERGVRSFWELAALSLDAARAPRTSSAPAQPETPSGAESGPRV